jgi:TatD DNase family protein
MNYWIDTHAHLYENAFNADRKEMIERAVKQGVHKIIIQNVDDETINGMLQLETDYPSVCLATMGLHPCSVKENYKQDLQWVEDWWSKRTFTAVGECGLDYHWDKTFIPQQKEAFDFQLQLGNKYNKPVVIHSRSSFYDSVELVKLNQKGNLSGVFHCFSGSYEEAKEALKQNFYLGIGGTVTYKNSGLIDVLPKIGLDRIVLETDAPYLPPVPHRGKRNESSYIPLVGSMIAEIMNMPVKQVAEITTANAKKLFQIND